ncbi:MAG: GNAT family N-acetyltransferase [Spirochaetota bacterium]
MKSNNNSVDISEMTIDDLPAVFHLGEKLFTPQEFPNLYRTWSEYAVTEIFQGDPELCLVAAVGESLAGFAMAYTIEKPRTAWNYGHLVWLGVDVPYQRFGVATKLLDCLQDKLAEKGVRILLVDTQADNKGAIQFFKNCGFKNPKEHVYLTLNLDENQDNNQNSK